MQKFFFSKLIKKKNDFAQQKRERKKIAICHLFLQGNCVTFFCLYETQLWHRKKKLRKKILQAIKHVTKAL